MTTENTNERVPVDPPGSPFDRETHTDPDGTRWIYMSRYSAWFTEEPESAEPEESKEN